jgi:hypothetical protein
MAAAQSGTETEKFSAPQTRRIFVSVEGYAATALALSSSMVSPAPVIMHSSLSLGVFFARRTSRPKPPTCALLHRISRPAQGVLQAVVAPEELPAHHEAWGPEDPELGRPPGLLAKALLVFRSLCLFDDARAR